MSTAVESSVIELKDETWAGSWPFAPHYYVNDGVQLTAFS